jgi:hypothetical protein
MDMRGSINNGSSAREVNNFQPNVRAERGKTLSLLFYDPDYTGRTGLFT